MGEEEVVVVEVMVVVVVVVEVLMVVMEIVVVELVVVVEVVVVVVKVVVVGVVVAVVVPMLRISEQSLGTAAATALAMRALPAAFRLTRCWCAMFSTVEPGMRTPPWKRLSRPSSDRRWTSRRTVCSVTPRACAKRSTLTEPSVFARANSFICLGLGSIALFLTQTFQATA